MMSLPHSDSSRLFPERNPSPTPTSSSNEPTPQAMPNMVRNERSLCAQRLRKICAKMSVTARMISVLTFQNILQVPVQPDVRSQWLLHLTPPLSRTLPCLTHIAAPQSDSAARP